MGAVMPRTCVWRQTGVWLGCPVFTTNCHLWTTALPPCENEALVRTTLGVVSLKLRGFGVVHAREGLPLAVCELPTAVEGRPPTIPSLPGCVQCYVPSWAVLLRSTPQTYEKICCFVSDLIQWLSWRIRAPVPWHVDSGLCSGPFADAFVQSDRISRWCSRQGPLMPFAMKFQVCKHVHSSRHFCAGVGDEYKAHLLSGTSPLTLFPLPLISVCRLGLPTVYDAEP